jgi:hypothetical protein
MERKTRFYYDDKDANKIYYLDEETGEFNSCYTYQKNYKTHNYFHLFKGYTPSEEGLTLFKSDFNKWNEELQQLGKMCRKKCIPKYCKCKCELNYKKYYDHFSATELIFKMFSSRCSKLVKNTFEDVSYDEYSFNEKCYNAGIIYLNPEYKDKTVNSFGYDFSSFYPHILVGRDLRIPTKQGEKIMLENLNFNNLQYGFYKVNITCNNKDFLKVFSFSKHQVYTHFSLLFAYKYKDVFDINLELVTDTDFNALVYQDENLIWSKDIFEKWFDVLYTQIKPKCSKDNKLIKHLLSSLWGSLIRADRYFFNEEQDEKLEAEQQGIYVRYNEKYYFENGKMVTRYELIKKEKPYKHHYGRLKAFILSLGRNIVGELIMSSGILDNVIRVATDGIVLNEPFDFTIGIPYYPKPEDKTTGMIKWKNVNNYFKEAS